MTDADATRDEHRPRRIAVLGSTGSIGTQTLRVVEHLNAQAHAAGEPPAFEVVALAANLDAAGVREQVSRHQSVRVVALADEGADTSGFACDVLTGAGAAVELVQQADADVVVASIVGVAGLRATLTALEMGTDVALANKEALVAAGPVMLAACERTGAKLLPVDSEHAAAWQALHASASGVRTPPFVCGPDLVKLTLTASGGALRDWPIERLQAATPADALAHPNWDMGAKVTIDTATMANKALELMEAAHLFGLTHERLDAVVHPQSIVHAVASYADGSSVAQLGLPDMCAPIQYALTGPARPAGVTAALSLTDAARLDFIEMDQKRYPAFFLGLSAIRGGGTMGASYNAANEAAVGAFVDGAVPFGGIPALIEAGMATADANPPRDLDDVFAADARARDAVRSKLSAAPT